MSKSQQLRPQRRPSADRPANRYGGFGKHEGACSSSPSDQGNRTLLDVVENTIETANPKVVKEVLLDVKDGLQELINDADSLSLEEKRR